MVARCGVLLPSFDPLRTGGPPQIVPAARLAEELGFDAVWAGDHLACPAPGLDAPGCLSAAAAVTERIGLGFSVMLLGLRAPAWAAKQLTTIDALASPGRLRLGVGVGGEFPLEFEAAGVPLTERGARLDDALTVLPELLTGRPVNYEGRAQTVHSPGLEPAMAAAPPVYVGGRGEAALKRVARFGDAWLPMWLSPARVRERSERLAELADEAGRPCPSTALLILTRIDDDAAHARRAAEAHIAGQYRMTLDAVARWTLLDSIDGAVQRLAQYAEVGVQEFLLLTLGDDTLTQYEHLADVASRLGPVNVGAGAGAGARAGAGACGGASAGADQAGP